MSLAPGVRIGPYEIVSMVGAGGMGEVYRARDTRLDRTVAIKVLPEQLAADAEFRERFDREAKAISLLNHPHICTLYDVGKAPGPAPEGRDTCFLVMEYLEGETLAQRLEKGPLSIPQALTVAIDIAGALDAAHCHGVVHRDMKPGNVFLARTAGSSGPTAKLLDFGLAKLGAAGALARGTMASVPTMGALTARGTLLGTFQYMAPEQIEGQESDARTDIFALGATLYEMLTGRRAFDGKSQASLLSAILKDEPLPLTQMQPLAPPALDHIVRTCLAKDPDGRFQTARDVWLELTWIKDTGSTSAMLGPAVARRTWRERVAWASAAMALATASAVAAWWLKPEHSATSVVTRHEWPLPDGQFLTTWSRRAIALSPDGTQLAYVANGQLYLRNLNQLEARPIPGTDEGPREPTFSPDGQWIAYVSTAGDFVLKKVPVKGGSPVTLCRLASQPSGIDWRRGTIVFGGGGSTGIKAVPDDGQAPPKVVVAMDPDKGTVSQPRFLDERQLMFVVSPPAASGFADDEIAIQTMERSDRLTVVKGGTDPHILPDGRLAYVHDGRLRTVNFDAKRRAVSGTSVEILAGASATASDVGEWQFAISDAGTLAFIPGATQGDRGLVWIDRQAHETRITPNASCPFARPRFSPDGTKVSIVCTGSEHNLWVLDTAKTMLTRLTFPGAQDLCQSWILPEGRELAYASLQGAGSRPRILKRAANGTGDVTVISNADSAGFPVSISPNGKWLVYGRTFGDDLMILPLDGTSQPRALLADPKFRERNGEISPDGKWIAYESNEAKRSEVFVRPFPDVEGGRWQVSTNGGTQPMWGHLGKELLFTTGDGRLVTVPILPGPEFTYGSLQPLFDVRPYYSCPDRCIDISPDGQRFIAIKQTLSVRPSIIVVGNWLDEIHAKR